MKTRENVIQKKSYAFALNILKMYKKRYKNYEDRDLLRQLLRSATSIGANVEEAEGGQSKKDFIAKMSIAYKEARESNYWLRLMRDGQKLSKEISNELIDESIEILKILTSILKASKLPRY